MIFMVSIKTWEEFKLSRRHGYKLIVYGSENKKSYIDFFGDNLYFCDNNTLDSDNLIYSGKTYEVISLSQLVNFDEELDIIISPQISYKEVMKLTRCFFSSTYEVLLFLGKRHEGIVVNGNTLDFKSALLLNYNVDKIYSDIPIPFYKYFQVIDDQISKAYDVMINYKKNYSIKDYEGEYVNHLLGKRRLVLFCVIFHHAAVLKAHPEAVNNFAVVHIGLCAVHDAVHLVFCLLYTSIHQNQMACAGNGQPFRNALYNAQNGRFQQI